MLLNCWQLLFPQTSSPLHSWSFSQSPSPSTQGLEAVQHFPWSTFLPWHLADKSTMLLNSSVGLTQQSSFGWKTSPNCLQLLFPQTSWPRHSWSVSQSPSPSTQGLEAEQHLPWSTFRPWHLGPDPGKTSSAGGWTQQSSLAWNTDPNCWQLLFPHTRPPPHSLLLSQSPSPSWV